MASRSGAERGIFNDRKFVFEWDASEDTSIDYNPYTKNDTRCSCWGEASLQALT